MIVWLKNVAFKGKKGGFSEKSIAAGIYTAVILYRKKI